MCGPQLSGRIEAHLATGWPSNSVEGGLMSPQNGQYLGLSFAEMRG